MAELNLWGSLTFMVLLLQFPLPSHQQSGTVTCFMANNCVGTQSSTDSPDNCCTGLQGRSFQRFGQEECSDCPLTFGFLESSLTGVEREEEYTVEVGFITGGTDMELIFEVQTMFRSLTANSLDFSLTSPRTLTFPSGTRDNQVVSFTFREDRVSQEVNEMVRLELVMVQGIISPDADLRLQLDLTIVDATEISFRLINQDCSATEGTDGAVSLLIERLPPDVFIGSPVSLTVEPLTISQAITQGLFADEGDDDPLAPVRADTNDFNPSNITVPFIPDFFQDSPQRFQAVSIDIVDDSADEASQQFFLAHLQLLSAARTDLIDVSFMDTRNCTITDNDNVTISFEFPSYTFMEPDNLAEIRDVVFLARDILSERTFSFIARTVEDSSTFSLATIRTSSGGTSYDFDVLPEGSSDNGVVLTLTPSTTRVPFNFVLRPDTLPEGPEAFTVSATSAPGFPTLPATSTLIIITDNDTIRVGFTQDSYTASESSGSVEVCVAVTNPTSEDPLSSAFSLVLTTSPGSADRNDFTERRTILTFAADDGAAQPRVQCISIIIANDDLVESNETFRVQLAPFTALDQPDSPVTIMPAEAEVVIVDNDRVEIGFSSDHYNVTEGDGRVTIQVGIISSSLQPGMTIPLTITLESETATSPMDYLPFPNGQLSLEVSSSNTTFSFDVAIVDDQELELQEQFLVHLSTSSPLPAVIITTKYAVIRVFDDDKLVIGFEDTVVRVLESVPSVVLQVSIRNGTIASGVEVLIQVASDDDSAETTATVGEDYEMLPATSLRFSRTVTSGSVEVIILRDTLREDDESIEVQISSNVLVESPAGVVVPTPADQITVAPRAAQIIIQDISSLSIGFLQESYTVAEDQGMVSLRVGITIGMQETDLTVVVRLTLISGTAIVASDYQFPATSQFDLALGPDATPISISIPIENDTVYEENEMFSAELSIVGEVPSRLFVSPSSASITILNDDALVLGFLQQHYDVVEGRGPVDLEIGVVAGSFQVNQDISIPVALSLIEGTAIVDSDFEGVSSNVLLTLRQNDNSQVLQVVSVPILNDDVFEDSEDFSAMLQPTGSLPQLISLGQTRTSIRIFDDDSLEVGFLNRTYTVSEGARAVTVEIGINSGTLNLALNFTLSIQLAFSDGSAVGGMDYSVAPTSFNLTVGPLNLGPRLLSVTIPILEDDILEQNENFEVRLDTTLPDRVNFGIQTAEIIILDNEDLVIGFLQEDYTVTESVGVVTVVFGVIGPPLITVDVLAIVELQLIAGTATLDNDYQALSSPSLFTLTTASVTDAPMPPITLTVAVRIMNDGVFEITERFQAMLRLLDSSLPRIVIRPAEATIVIVDDDRLQFSLIPKTLQVPEDVGTIGSAPGSMLAAVLTSGEISQGIVVSLNGSTSDDSPRTTATVGVDYIPVRTEFQFSREAAATQPFFISIIDDTTTESTETIEAVLEGNSLSFNGIALPFPSDRISVAVNSTVIFITENDEMVTVGFLRPVYSVTESSGQVELTVGITSGSGSSGPVSVSVVLSLTSGTALSGEDFVDPPAVITVIPDAMVPTTFPIQLISDSIAEPAESFTATLTMSGPPLPNLVISPNTTRIVVTDNDTLEFGFLQDSYVVREEQGDFVVNLGILSGSLQEAINVTLQLQTLDNTAFVDSDYRDFRLSTFTLTLGPSTSVFPSFIPIQLINDDIFEVTESFQVLLVATSLPPRIQLGRASTNITIIDEDNITIGFSQRKYVFSESARFATIDVEITSGTPSVPVIVVLELFFTDARAVLGDDYSESFIRTVGTFNIASRRLEIQNPIINDNVFEVTEDFNVRLRLTRTSRVFTSLENSVICIRDDDVLDFGFVPLAMTVSESSGTVFLNANLLSGVIAEGLIVSLRAFTDGSSPRTTATAGSDYQPFTGLELQFTTQTSSQAVPLTIINDDIYEQVEAVEVGLGDVQVMNSTLSSDFLSRVTISGSPALVTITDDDNRVVSVNDTVSADPLFTVPIRVSDSQLQVLNVERLSLCYEVHGQPGKWFNLVTDSCASINAHYKFLTRSINVIDTVGVRAVDRDGKCISIRVEVDQCAASVNNIPLTGQYSAGGVSVKRYHNRVRLSLPNCADIPLVLWVVCEDHRILNPKDHGILNVSMLKLVVMRGLNLDDRRAHGLLGQFWNVPVSVVRFEGLVRGGFPAISRYTVSLTTNNDSRTYTGRLRIHNWALENDPCLYVGGKQSDPAYEVLGGDPNDPVIQGKYTDYQVPDAFSEDGYRFGLFQEDKCIEGSGAPLG